MDYSIAYFNVMIALTVIFSLGAMVYNWIYTIENQMATAFLLGLTVTLWPVMIPCIILFIVVSRFIAKKGR